MRNNKFIKIAVFLVFSLLSLQSYGSVLDFDTQAESYTQSEFNEQGFAISLAGEFESLGANNSNLNDWRL